ncbi:MAG: carboxypeptidase regulatory-like domain-containing protein [bacterium]
MAGTIKDAVTGAAISGVAISVREGLNNRTGSTISGKTDTTNGSGAYTLSSMDAGSYTIEGTKDGLITTYFDAISCSGISSLNANMTTVLAEGNLRIVLSWEGSDDFDSHLEIPCTTGTCSGSTNSNNSANQADKSHLWYSINHADSVNYTGVATKDYHDWGSGVYVTLDQDNTDSADGPETITIGQVQSGDYRYHVHAYDQKNDSNTRNLADNKTSVTVYYEVNKSKIFYVPSAAGNLWTVFDYNKDSGFSTLNTMADENNQGDVDDH